jgi:hypothetical protein
MVNCMKKKSGLGVSILNLPFFFYKGSLQIKIDKKITNYLLILLKTIQFAALADSAVVYGI